MASNIFAFFTLFAYEIYFCCLVVYGVKIEYLKAVTQIQARFATTLVSSKLKNEETKEVEVKFTAVLPDEAFITNFTMFINDKIIIGNVKEKEEAKRVYDSAKLRGESAGHILQKPRETSTFQIEANLAARSTVVFNLTYQEMLKRVHDVYKHVINLQPETPPDQIQVDVFITERGQVRNLRVPKFGPKVGEMTNKQLLVADEEPDVQIKKNIGSKLSNVQVSLKPKGKEGGQLVVLYDVVRDKSAGDIEVVNGHFVHFFAPEGIKLGSKNVIFVLDKSGSMEGRKIQQLKDAMKSILSDLDPSDKFNILMFSTAIEKWKAESVLATSANVEAAKEFIRTQDATGSTALNDALVQGLGMLHADAPSSGSLLSMLLFMTDGLPTEGESSVDRIVQNVDRADVRDFPVHCMGFGNDVDYDLLKKISGRHRGLARKIYEDADAVLQITGFFDEIRSPLLTELKINYLNESVEIDSLVFMDKNYYQGGEAVVVGKLKDGASSRVEQGGLRATVSGTSAAGPVRLEAKSASWACPLYQGAGWSSRPFWRCCPPVSEPAFIVPRRHCCWPDCCWGYYDYCPPVPPPIVPPPPTTPRPLLPAETVGGFVERMWAYKSIQKIFRQIDSGEMDKTTLQKNALDMSLRYHFVTPLTSMVVVDPSQTSRPSFEKNRGEEGAKVQGSGGANLGGVAPSQAGKFGSFGLGGPIAGEEKSGPVPPPPPKPNRSQTLTTNRANKPSGCTVYVIFVIDTVRGTSVDVTALYKKVVDQLANKFTQNSYVTVLLSDQSGNTYLSKTKISVVSDSASLKDATQVTPKKYEKPLTDALKNALSKNDQDSHVIVFFSASDSSAAKSLKSVEKLKSDSSAAIKLKNLVISLDGSLSINQRKLADNSLSNIFVTPDPADLVQAIRCT